MNIEDLRLGFISVGAAFQPRLNDYGSIGLPFVAGKPLPRAVGVKLLTLGIGI